MNANNPIMLDGRHKLAIGQGLSSHEAADGTLTLDRIPFSALVLLTAAAAATPVILVDDSVVPAGKKCYVEDIGILVRGGTAWTDSTGTKVSVQDTDSLAFADIAKAALTALNAIGNLTSGVTLGAAMANMTGGNVGKGVQVVADHNFAAGSNLAVGVRGYFGD